MLVDDVKTYNRDIGHCNEFDLLHSQLRFVLLN